MSAGLQPVACGGTKLEEDAAGVVVIVVAAAAATGTAAGCGVVAAADGGEMLGNDGEIVGFRCGHSGSLNYAQDV